MPPFFGEIIMENVVYLEVINIFLVKITQILFYSDAVMYMYISVMQ